jgi:hypothetical protein
MKTHINVINKEFIVDKGVVVCLITAKTDYPYEILKLIDTLDKEAPMYYIRTRGIARCSKEDNFDVRYGKKLAEARAMKEVFKGFNKYFKKLETYTRFFDRFVVRGILSTNLAVQSEENHINWLKK